MPKRFRESKYLNETGSKTGNWYMNRMDYFQFHQYPKYKQHKYLSLIVSIVLFFIAMKVIKSSFLLSLPIFYSCYIAALTFYILRENVCRYRGYFLYPKKIIAFFRTLEIDVDVNDFDSIATMSKK